MPVNETTLASTIFDQLQRAMARDPAGFTELYRDYLADAWETVGVLREGVVQRRPDDVRAGAHRLKGSSMVLGACGVAQCAAALEELGRIGDIEGAGPVLERTGQALREVEAELTARLGAGVVPAAKTGAS
jgi:HPt (histidine-containing phosphotransfer) domain-containing protein